MTVDAQYTAPAADPMHTMLENALTPYLNGDLPATDTLIDRLFEVIATADRDASLITTLYSAIKGLTPSHELIEPMYKAIGAAYEFSAPAPAHSSSVSASPSQAAARNRRGGPRDGSLGEQIIEDMSATPGQPWKIGDLAKKYGGAHRNGAVGAAMKGLVERGLAVPVTVSGERAVHYLLTEDPAAPAQIPDTAPAPAESAPVTETPEAPAEQAPAPDTAPAESAEAPKTAGTRRTAAKTGK
jgi:hypothetical protein